MFWFKSLLLILFFSSFQITYTVSENDATHKNLTYVTSETEVQDRLYAILDRLNVIWENNVQTSVDSVFKLDDSSLKTKLKWLCGHKNNTALLYISFRNFIDLHFETHRIAYQFHSFP